MAGLKSLASSRQGQRRGDPAGHHVLHPVRRVRRAVPEAGLHRRRAVQPRTSSSRTPLGSDATQLSRRAVGHHQGRQRAGRRPARLRRRRAHRVVRQAARRGGHRLRPADPGRHPLLLRQLQQRQGRPGHGPGPGVLRHRLGRQEPQRHRDEGRPDRQQRDAVRPGLRRRARPVLLRQGLEGRQQPGRDLGPADRAVGVPAAVHRAQGHQRGAHPERRERRPDHPLPAGPGRQAEDLPDHRAGRHADRPAEHPDRLPVRHRLQADLPGGPGRRRARHLRAGRPDPAGRRW